MRLVLMMASLVIVSLLIFKGYSSSLGNLPNDQAGGKQLDPLKKAEDVNQLIQDAANIKRQELERQLQQ